MKIRADVCAWDIETAMLEYCKDNTLLPPRYMGYHHLADINIILIGDTYYQLPRLLGSVTHTYAEFTSVFSFCEGDSSGEGDFAVIFSASSFLASPTSLSSVSRPSRNAV